MATDDAFALPRGWTKTVRSSVLHAISVAFAALTRAWGSAAKGRRSTTRLQADLDRADTEVALLREELAIKDARWSRVRSRKRHALQRSTIMAVGRPATLLLQSKLRPKRRVSELSTLVGTIDPTSWPDPRSHDAGLKVGLRWSAEDCRHRIGGSHLEHICAVVAIPRSPAPDADARLATAPRARILALSVTP